MGIKDISRRRLIAFIVLGVFALILISFITNSKVGAILEGMRPPKLPAYQAANQQVWLEQNWTAELTREYHHKSQGTHTIPIPLEWFLALEQPKGGLLGVPFGREDRFASNEYLLRFGFIEGIESESNPYALPVGFATTPLETIPGVRNKQTALGFTCAACHTNKLHYNDIEYVIEGGPAQTDLGLLTQALSAAIGQTFVSSKIPIFDGRFKRFAKNVLQEGYNDGSMLALKADLENLVTFLAEQPKQIGLIEGFSRLDALNRIGNQVFALDPKRYENYVAPNAPVAYPHIWTASWFDWVQYDGSIMQPLVRNAGEALGVRASLNTTAPKEDKRFSSSVPIQNLSWIEEVLAGDPPLPDKNFNGLLSPAWPDTFPAIDQAKANQGAQLYREHCQGCHLPPLNSDEIWEEPYFDQIAYQVEGETKYTPESVLQLKMIALEQIGTDSAQADVLVDRRVNTAADVNPSNPVFANGIGIDSNVCVPQPLTPQSPYRTTLYRSDEQPLVSVPITDGPGISFALALGAVVQQTNNAWFEQNFITGDIREYYEGQRPNCLRAGAGYKARPLNGIWATAPFLHNGSVPTLMDLLMPANERPELVKLGNVEFDPVNVGLVQGGDMDTVNDTRYTRGGFFVLDTTVKGNSNVGHEFSDRWDENKHYDNQEKGVIGPELSQQEKEALVEYLKTL